jgi:hypothetical protein
MEWLGGTLKWLGGIIAAISIYWLTQGLSSTPDESAQLPDDPRQDEDPTPPPPPDDPVCQRFPVRAQTISTTSRDARVVEGDSELDSDDWTSVEVSYEIEVSDREILLELNWAAQELNRDGTRGDTRIHSQKTFRIFELGGDYRSCEISGISAASLSQENDERYRGEVHDWQRFPTTGLLTNINVKFDGEGGNDQRVQALDAEFAGFSVDTQGD